MIVGDRFWDKVEKLPEAPGCWLWAGCISQGYGYYHVSTAVGMVSAHRVAYMALVGPVPHGKELDHKCRVRCCVNPEHLEPVTTRENILRGEGVASRLARQTHCKRGHEFSGESLYVDPSGVRRCRICRRGRWNPWHLGGPGRKPLGTNP